MIPGLRYLRKGHECNYCHSVHGVTFSDPPKIVARLAWVKCDCGKKHYACWDCARRIGRKSNGRKVIAICAKGYKIHTLTELQRPKGAD